MAQDSSGFYRVEAERMLELAACAQDQNTRIALLEMAARFRETAFAMNAAARRCDAANVNIDQRRASERA